MSNSSFISNELASIVRVWARYLPRGMVWRLASLQRNRISVILKYSRLPKPSSVQCFRWAVAVKVGSFPKGSRNCLLIILQKINKWRNLVCSWYFTQRILSRYPASPGSCLSQALFQGWLPTAAATEEKRGLKQMVRVKNCGVERNWRSYWFLKLLIWLWYSPLQLTWWSWMRFWNKAIVSI